VCNIPTYSTDAVAHTATTYLMNFSINLLEQQRMLQNGDRSNFTVRDVMLDCCLAFSLLTDMLPSWTGPLYTSSPGAQWQDAGFGRWQWQNRQQGRRDCLGLGHAHCH
jgi:hypothetical protein